MAKNRFGYRTVIEVTNKAGETVKVIDYLNNNGEKRYAVEVDGIDKHGECTAEDVIRALGSYLHTEKV